MGAGTTAGWSVGLEGETWLFSHMWKVSRVSWASRCSACPTALPPALSTAQSWLWEPGVQHGQSLRDGATVLALLADEVAVMDEVVHSPENRGCKERRGHRDQGHTESLGAEM